MDRYDEPTGLDLYEREPAFPNTRPSEYRPKASMAPSEATRDPIVARDILRKKLETAVENLFNEVTRPDSGTYSDSGSRERCSDKVEEAVRWFREVQRAQDSKR